MGAVSRVARSLTGCCRRWPPWAIALAATLTFGIALYAANWVYAAQARDAFILAGSPGDLLYVSTFSGFLDEWDLYEGQQSASVADEQLELSLRSPQTAAWTSASHRFRDFDFSVSLRAIAGPVDNAMGAVFHARAPDAGSCDLPALILCGIDQLLPLAGAALRQAFEPAEAASHYAFLISSDGYYSLRRTEAGSTKVLSAWIASEHIHQGLEASNTIRVVARDANYRFFVNGASLPLCLPYDAAAASTFVGGECLEGEMRAEYPGESGSSGGLGLIAQSTATGGAGVVVRFDNLLVYEPAAPMREESKL